MIKANQNNMSVDYKTQYKKRSAFQMNLWMSYSNVSLAVFINKLYQKFEVIGFTLNFYLKQYLV